MHMNNGIIHLLILSVALSATVQAQDATELHQKGIAALKESQINPREIVQAARHFSKAAELYEAEGKTDLAVEMNSYLYWCKKKMNIDDINKFTGAAEGGGKKFAAIDAQPVPDEEAKIYFERAQKFAEANPTEPLLIAVRYFEVADRFKKTDLGLKAMDESLKAMQKIQQAPAAKAGKAPPPDLSPIGMWDVSDPAGDLKTIWTFNADGTFTSKMKGGSSSGSSGQWKATGRDVQISIGKGGGSAMKVQIDSTGTKISGSNTKGEPRLGTRLSGR